MMPYTSTTPYMMQQQQPQQQRQDQRHHSVEEPEEFLGMVKSYNERRGFGFAASEATAMKFGRDVYIAKAEARLAFEDGGVAPSGPRKSEGGKQQAPSLAEEDLIRFRVRFSADGMPQAEKIRRVRKFTGVVTVAPDASNESVGRVTSDELYSVRGRREAVLRRVNCGQARFNVGDRITFCVDGAAGHGPLDALLVLLVPRSMQILDHVLGCFSLTLPRCPSPESWPSRSDFTLDCHALADRIILSGLPLDVEENELLKFFTKHGATGVAMARSSTCAFASVGFPGTTEIVRFVGRAMHTFADDKESHKESRLVHLMPCRVAGGCKGSLPGLPAPMLVPSEEPGAVIVRWSPIVLATGYIVDLRPAGTNAPWSQVEAPDGSFSKHAASCRVAGLPTSVPFEARITYLTSCGCWSDPSEASSWCLAYPTMVQSQGVHSTPNQWGQQNTGVTVPSYQPLMTTPPPPVNSDPWAWQNGAQQQTSGSAGWRCPHGTSNPPPVMPELKIVDDAGYSLVVQWPSVPQATAYVVELREPGALRAERFVRSMPMQMPMGSLVELRVGGLRPAVPGCCYVAQVRSITQCGCESEPSPAAVLTTNAPVPTAGQGMAISLADACAPPSSGRRAEASYSKVEGSPEKTSGTRSNAPVPTLPPVAYGTAPGMHELPSLLGRMSPVASPSMGSASIGFGMPEPVKEMAPEIAGNEEDGGEECIILD